MAKKREKWGKSGSADLPQKDLAIIMGQAKTERRSKSAQIAVELDAAFAHLDAGGTWAGGSVTKDVKFNKRIEFTLPEHTFKRLGQEAAMRLRTNAAQAAMTIYHLHRHLEAGAQLATPRKSRAPKQAKQKRSTPRRKRGDRAVEKEAA